MGDFNNITKASEKQGVRPFASGSNRGLAGVMDELGLVDLDTQATPLPGITNVLMHAIPKNVLIERLLLQIGVFFPPNSTLQHLNALHSDHKSILLHTIPPQPSHPRPFHFESMWLRDQYVSNVVIKAWNLSAKGSPTFIFSTKLRSTKNALKSWNRSKLGNFSERKLELQSLIEQCQNST